MQEIRELLHDCTLWAKEAGRVQLEYFRSSNLDIKTKFNDSDIVTAADKVSEEIIISNIRKKYPTHSILSEESGTSGYENDYRWVIDPLDGTTNFSSGLPEFCVSIGIQYKNQTIIGVVFAPYLGELFYAVRGEGAFLNGKKISTGNNTDIHKAVVTTGFPVDKDRTTDNNLDNVARVLPLVRGLRRLGSAALELAYTACGRQGGYFEVYLNPWDYAAGMLLVQEAGGKVSDWNGRKLDPAQGSQVAGTNGQVHEELLKLLL